MLFFLSEGVGICSGGNNFLGIGGGGILWGRVFVEEGVASSVFYLGTEDLGIAVLGIFAASYAFPFNFFFIEVIECGEYGGGVFGKSDEEFGSVDTGVVFWCFG